MSKYTTEVRFICEELAGYTESKGLAYIDDIITKSEAKIFGSYPIFDENYRSELNKKILYHYYTREIGYETYALWILKLNVKLNEIMPYYNQLYNSALIEFDPLNNVNLKTTGNKQEEQTDKYNGTKEYTENNKETGSRDTLNTNKTNTDNDTTTSNTEENGGSKTENNEDLFSDTPQGSLSGLEDNTYLTEARLTENKTTTNYITHNNGSTKQDVEHTELLNEAQSHKDEITRTGSDTKTNENNMNNSQDYYETIIGKNNDASYSQMIQEFRKTFLNIDMMVISELETLFIGLWE